MSAVRRFLPLVLLVGPSVLVLGVAIQALEVRSARAERDAGLLARRSADPRRIRRRRFLSLRRRPALCDAGRRSGRLPFDGRIAEDFKLATGTWVSVGPLRAALVSALAPLARDAAIAGDDRDDATALIFPDPDACRAETGTQDLNAPALREAFRHRLAAFAGYAPGSSKRLRGLCSSPNRRRSTPAKSPTRAPSTNALSCNAAPKPSPRSTRSRRGPR